MEENRLSREYHENIIEGIKSQGRQRDRWIRGRGLWEERSL